MAIKLSSLKSYKLNQKGATLVELLISLALLAVITTVFIQIITSSISLRSKSDLQKEASAIAEGTVEALKLEDEVPTQLTTTVDRPDGYRVETVLVDKTTSLSLSSGALGQASGTAFDTADLIIDFGENITVSKSAAIATTKSLDGLVDGKINFSVIPISGSTDTHEYRIQFDNALGNQEILLGNYTRTLGSRKLIKLNITSALAHHVKFIVNDTTAEPLHFGIFDNESLKMQVNESGTGTDLLVTDGYLTSGEGNVLSQKYYEVTVTVSKDSKEYARILTTWAVKGD